MRERGQSHAAADLPPKKGPPRLGELQSRSGPNVEKKNILPLPGIESQLLKNEVQVIFTHPSFACVCAYVRINVS
jgi:hypothetical protein